MSSVGEPDGTIVVKSNCREFHWLAGSQEPFAELLVAVFNCRAGAARTDIGICVVLPRGIKFLDRDPND